MDQINIDYYIGSYGLTILIRIEADEMLGKFYDLINSLSSLQDIDLKNYPFISLSSIDKLVLTLENKYQGKNMVIRNKDIKWKFNDEHLQNCLGLILGLRDSSKAGHQYLTQENFDDAIVELSFKENLGNK